MTNPPTSTQAQIQNGLPGLIRLADLLLKHRAAQKKSLVIPFVGAGASLSAGLPASSGLQSRIYEELVRQPGSHSLALLLDEEARALFGEREGILKLSLFQFAAVLSRFAYARKVIHQVIRSVMAKATHRPLAYELLAHLAKHRYIDHFVSVNFDELLDKELVDELPDRRRFVSSKDDLPGPGFARDARSQVCYLFKPFGTLSADNYRIEVEDVQRYGSESVWRFMLDSVFKPTVANSAPDVVLILVGYAAAEAAFSQLMEELLANSRRKISVFVVDPRDSLPETIQAFHSRQNFQASHIALEADTAFDLLLRIMEMRFRKANPHGIWIPIARHRIVSALPHRSITDHDSRFELELILQAVKSRGFFTLEAVAEIERIRNYDDNACRVLQELRDSGIIEAQPNRLPEASELRQVYVLHDDDPQVLSATLLKRYPSLNQKTLVEWKLGEDSDGAYTARVRKTTPQAFLEARFKEIAGAPEIEVSHAASPSTPWLFEKPTPLDSVTSLTEATAQLFNLAIDMAADPDRPVEIYGVWTTGEWLFHDRGWAWSRLGRHLISLMNARCLKLSMILAENPMGKRTTRLERRAVVMERLKEPIRNGFCEVRYNQWWQQNRILSLLYWSPPHGEREAHGIYMRRRLATPLVAPVEVKGGADCAVLKAIFDNYHAKSEAAPESEHEQPSATGNMGPGSRRGLNDPGRVPSPVTRGSAVNPERGGQRQKDKVPLSRGWTRDRRGGQV